MFSVSFFSRSKYIIYCFFNIRQRFTNVKVKYIFCDFLQGRSGPSVREFPDQAPGWQDQQEGVQPDDATMLPQRRHWQAGKTHLQNVRHKLRRKHWFQVRFNIAERSETHSTPWWEDLCKGKENFEMYFFVWVLVLASYFFPLSWRACVKRKSSFCFLSALSRNFAFPAEVSRKKSRDMKLNILFVLQK